VSEGMNESVSEDTANKQLASQQTSYSWTVS